jgi:MFS family permease
VLVLIGMVTSVVSSLGAPLLPTIARVDHVSLGDAEWSLTVTLFVGAVAAPVLGRLGDGPGRRSVILMALGGVCVGSVLAALPGSSFVLLLLGRALHGLGLGLMPLTMAVARDSLPEHRSRPAIALLSIATVAGVGLGYPVTGVLDEAFGLHGPFWFGAITSAVVFVAAVAVLPASSHLSRRRLDIPGAVLLGAALIAVLLGITEGQPWGWSSPRIVAILVAGALLFGAWVWREDRCSRPLVDLSLLRHPVVAVTNGTAFLIAMAMYMFFPLLTDFVQTPRSVGYGFGASVVATGLMLVPMSVLTTSMSRVAARLGARFGAEIVVPIGAVVMSVGVVLFALPGGGLWEGFVAMGVVGIGTGFTFAAMPGLIIRSVPAPETGSALGFYQVSRYVGFSFGSAVAASVLASYTPGHRVLPERAGFTVAFAVGALICVVAAVISATVGRSAHTSGRSVPESLPTPDVAAAADRTGATRSGGPPGTGGPRRGSARGAGRAPARR